MCGRFTVTAPGDIAGELGVEVPPEVAAAVEPQYNIAPTEPVIAIANRGDTRRAELMRWGLVPHWAKGPGEGAKFINARSETAATKPAFRDALARRRCLVPADGFYEWKREGKLRTPFYITRPDHALFTFAGLWERWKQPDGAWLITCSILTGPANTLIAPLHDRMPIVVEPEDRERWLHPEPLEAVAVEDILRPPPDELFEMFEVSREVNNVHNDGPQLIARGPVQPRLL